MTTSLRPAAALGGLALVWGAVAFAQDAGSGTEAVAAQPAEAVAAQPAEAGLAPAVGADGTQGPASQSTDASMDMSPAQEDRAFSEVETTLWLVDQMSSIERPSRLQYAFERKGSYDLGFTDAVVMDVVSVREDGSRGARVDFFSGERKMWTPPFESVTGNPVLGLYLQGDTYEMERLSEGNWRYFHRRIKMAFSESAEMKPVQVSFDGRTIEAKQIRITPYALDDRRDRYEQFADKSYLITVSPEIPGYLYEIHTVVPGEIRPDGTRAPEPLIEERLVLTKVEELSEEAAATATGPKPDEAAP